MADDPSFEIPERPKRQYSRRTVQYDGDVNFTLTPAHDRETDQLEALVIDVLDTGPYRYGEWFDLPMTLFLVHDDQTNDTFRVSIRDGSVTLHVLQKPTRRD
ncbi:hypothetical protein [Halocatena marina]|uniref:hypothetical protein n=1 Tax=Halocatena marina TaxID=2934937 RepID=UPI0034A52A83